MSLSIKRYKAQISWAQRHCWTTYDLNFHSLNLKNHTEYFEHLKTNINNATYSNVTNFLPEASVERFSIIIHSNSNRELFGKCFLYRFHRKCCLLNKESSENSMNFSVCACVYGHNGNTKRINLSSTSKETKALSTQKSH